jgi:hypothetical protein
MASRLLHDSLRHARCSCTCGFALRLTSVLGEDAIRLLQSLDVVRAALKADLVQP